MSFHYIFKLRHFVIPCFGIFNFVQFCSAYPLSLAIELSLQNYGSGNRSTRGKTTAKSKKKPNLLGGIFCVLLLIFLPLMLIPSITLYSVLAILCCTPQSILGRYYKISFSCMYLACHWCTCPGKIINIHKNKIQEGKEWIRSIIDVS